MEVPKPNNYSMKDLLAKINDNNIRLPDFQRDFRWKLNDINELLISMLNGFPIGTFLFWEMKDNADSIPSRPFEKVDTNGKEKAPLSMLVLDGQQRLSSLFQLFYSQFTKPKDRSETKFFLKVGELMKGNIDDSIDYHNSGDVKRKHLDEKNVQVKEGLLPLDILLFDRKLEEWKTSYSFYKASLKSNVDKISEAFESLAVLSSSLFYDNKPVRNLIDFQVNVIELSSNTNLETVATIFEKLNTTGAALDIFEILTAKFHNKLNVSVNGSQETTLRGLWQKTLERFPNIKNYNDKMKGNVFPQLIIKSILLAKGKEIKRKNMLGSRDLETDDKLQPSDLDVNWLDTANAFEEAIKELKSNYGCPSVNFLPYTTMLAPFSIALKYIQAMPSNKQMEAKRKVERWYWYSVFSQRYDSATDSRSKSDLEELRDWINDNKSMEIMSTSVLNVDELNLREITSTGALFTGVMNLILKNGATDFATSSPLIETDKGIDVHHLYPEKQFKDDKDREKCDSLLNKTLMESETNRVIISDQMPKTYVDYFKNHGSPDVYQHLKNHFIPEAEFLSGSLTDFDEFMNKRSQLLKAKIKQLISG